MLYNSIGSLFNALKPFSNLFQHFVWSQEPTASPLAPILFDASTPAVVHYSAASEEDVTPPDTPRHEDSDEAHMGMVDGISSYGGPSDAAVMNGDKGGAISPCVTPELHEDVEGLTTSGADKHEVEHSAVDDAHTEGTEAVLPSSEQPFIAPVVAVEMDGQEHAPSQDTVKSLPRLGTTVPKQVNILSLS